MKTLFALVVIALLLSGCGLHEFNISDGIVQVEMRKENARAACYQEQARMKPDYSKLSDMAVVVLEQQRMTAQLVGAITGKSLDPCGTGTNLNDVLIADVTQRNETVRSLGGKALSATQFAVGAWAATEIVDSIGVNSGSRTYGDNSTISTTRTSSESSTRAVNAGDGSATTSPTTDPVGVLPVDTATVDPVITP